MRRQDLHPFESHARRKAPPARARAWLATTVIALGLGGAAALSPSKVVLGDLVDDLHVRYLISFATQLADTQRSSGGTPSVVICVLDNPFGAALMNAASAGSLTGRSITTLTLQNLNQMGTCNLLFIPRSQAPNLAAILEAAGNDVLTVAAIPGFLMRGGMVQLDVDGEGVGYKTSPRGYELAGGTPRDLLAAGECARQGRAGPPDPERVTGARKVAPSTGVRAACIDQVRQLRIQADALRETQVPLPAVPDEPDGGGTN